MNRLWVLALGGALAAGCGERPDRSIPAERDVAPEGPAPAADTPPAPVPEAAAVPDTGWSVRDLRIYPSGGIAVLTGVRTATHPGFDRMVMEFAGDTLPGVTISYVDRPQHECGSGAEVWLKGDAWLSVKLEPAQAHTDSGAATVRERHRQPALPNLLELRMTCDFEAQVEWVAGVRSPVGYRVLRLTRPARLVVDVKHPRQGGSAPLHP